MRRAFAVAGAGAALTLVALLFDAAPLFVPGVALAALGLLTPAWVWLAAGGIEVRRSLAADRVLEGEPVEAILEIRRGVLRPPGLEVFDPLGGETVWQSGSPSLRGAARNASAGVAARFHRRGRHTIPPPSVTVRDPLELVRVRRAGAGAFEVLVLPRPEPVHWIGHELDAGAELAAGRFASEPLAATELDGLRPYRVGTPASRIHWAALARGAGLLERRMTADADTRPLVVLDARCEASAGERLDAAIRAAASLTLELARRGGCGLLLPGDRRAAELDPELRAWPAVHARLALVGGGPASRLPALARGARLGRVFYVAAETPRRLPNALLEAGAPAAVLVLPQAVRAAGRGELAFEVAGCYGYVLGLGRRRAARERAA
ncbi:MAG: DUF58 domain-containing protein [Solirubrobacterales bacterium]|nr:DUF58 domain-containing protein [Solirubrobacterales bacterium]MBV9716478.1 DUF58 domain-containing protein [Solirubrobacterales bacterium]